MVRNEEPLFRLPNLDGEHPSEDATIQVIDAYLDMLGAKHVGAWLSKAMEDVVVSGRLVKGMDFREYNSTICQEHETSEDILAENYNKIEAHATCHSQRDCGDRRQYPREQAAAGWRGQWSDQASGPVVKESKPGQCVALFIVGACEKDDMLLIQVFSFTDMSAAFRLLGSGNHIDKLAVSDGEGSRISLPMRHAPRTMGIQSSECHLIISGLKGLCASLAVHTAKNGDKYLAVFSRSGYNDEASQEVCPRYTDLGYEIDLLAGDGTVLKDETPHALMTVDEYHAALECKVRGSWHLHDTTVEMGLALDFLIMLSSISGLYGGKSPANYAAGNTFLNAFSAYRRNLRLQAHSLPYVGLGLSSNYQMYWDVNQIVPRPHRGFPPGE
ncbi:hypothetical protein S40288_08089 [Stachybotrys chartarum IBT 40288]|nr:hypothetical protein S40288_08089 [Stachybotrys chartarum IBT 40288]